MVIDHKYGSMNTDSTVYRCTQIGGPADSSVKAEANQLVYKRNDYHELTTAGTASTEPQ